MLKAAVLVALACVSHVTAEPQLNDVKVRFEAPLVEMVRDPAFISIPKNTTSATNYNKLGENCVSEFANGVKFYGYRYKPVNSDNQKDAVFISLYDVQGSIAGVQACWPMSMLDAQSEEEKLDVNGISSYQVITEEGEEFACQTAYFIEPEEICTEGRSADQVKAEGTVSQLSFQWGKTPEDLKIPPVNRAGAAAEKWSTNNCFDRMGYHNFYDVESYSDTNCLQLHGYFLLYNTDFQLIGFGCRFEGESKSKYTETPPSLAVKIIQGCAPQCIVDRTNKFKTATMHVYFVSDPTEISCGATKNFWNVWYARTEADSHNCPNDKAPY